MKFSRSRLSRGVHALGVVLPTYALLAAGCAGRPSTPATGDAPASTAPSAAASVASGARPWSAPASTLEPTTGRAEALSEPPLEAAAAGRQVETGRTYVRATIKAGVDDPASWTCRTTPGQPHAAAVIAPNAEVWVRVTSTTPPAALRFVCERPGSLPQGEGFGQGATRILVVNGVDKAPTVKGKASPLRGFYGALAAALQGPSDDLPVRAFQSARAELLAQGSVEKPDAGVQGRRAPTELGALMNVYSGFASVEEALQTDRGLRLRGEGPAKRTIDAATLAPVTVPSPDWKTLRAALPPGAKADIEPLAAALPADTFVATFRDLRDLAALAREVDETLGPVVRALRGTGGDRLFGDREERRLCIERTPLSEALGHLAAGRVGLVAGDPWVALGSDLALVFEVKDPTLLEGVLDGFVTRARARRPDLETTTVKVAGRDVRVVRTPDGEIAQHRIRLGDRLVVANGPEILERLISVAEGRSPSLASLDEFSYFRALFPANAPEESGFLFVSDAAVLRTTSPASKILDARRTEAQADLAAVNGAALLHARLEGRLPESGDALVKSGLLAAAELAHSTGERITYDPRTGARSELGTLAGMRPLEAQRAAFKKVTVSERDAYVNFRETYQAAWRAADPAALRIERLAGGTGWAFETKLLPLVEGTEYDQLRRLVGSTRMTPSPAGAGARWQVAVGRDSEMRRELEQAGHSMLGTAALAWLGDWVAVGALESGALWDLAVASKAVPALRWPTDGAPREELKHLVRLPVYVEAQIADGLSLAALLTAVRRQADEATAGLVDWGLDTPWREVPITRIRERPRAQSMLGVEGLSLYYAVVADRFVASLDRATLEHRIDVALDTPAAAAGAATQVSFEFTPTRPSPVTRTLLATADDQFRHAHALALRGFELATEGTGRQALDAADAQTFTVGHLGLWPESPWGGTFRRDDPALGALHDLRGRGNAPIAPVMPPEGAPLTRFMAELERLSARVELDDVPGVGPGRALRARLEWKRRAK